MVIVIDDGLVVVVKLVIVLVGICLECLHVFCPDLGLDRSGWLCPVPSVGGLRLLFLEHFIRWYVLFY